MHVPTHLHLSCVAFCRRSPLKGGAGSISFRHISGHMNIKPRLFPPSSAAPQPTVTHVIREERRGCRELSSSSVLVAPSLRTPPSLYRFFYISRNPSCHSSSSSPLPSFALSILCVYAFEVISGDPRNFLPPPEVSPESVVLGTAANIEPCGRFKAEQKCHLFLCNDPVFIHLFYRLV